METKVLVSSAIGTGVGALQTPLIREFVDRKYPTTNIPGLKGFGYPSALFGTVGGGLALVAGIIGTTKGKDGRPRMADVYIAPAIDYGITAFVTGIFSGLYPAVTEADCAAKGGYFYDGVCHKEPATPTGSMQPGIQAAGSYTYKPPLIAAQAPAIDMNVLKQMSAEINRLGQENASLRVQAQVLPGQVASKQRRYGFMDSVETAQPLVGRRTETLRKKFDFMG